MDTILSDGTGSIFRSIVGIFFLIGFSYLLSSNRKAISWRLVFSGLALQVALAFAVLHIPFIQYLFEFVGRIFILILDFTKAGSLFVFGDIANSDKFGFVFAFQVLPAIVFFSALTNILFYFGIVQAVVYGFAWAFSKVLKLSGAESLSVVSTIFLGQSEAPLLVKPYLAGMSKSEILMIMTAGMAMMSGSILAFYIGLLGGTDPVQKLVFAKHLLAASVMAAPGAVVVAKILSPQSENINQEIFMPKNKVGSNFLEAIFNGTMDGIKLTASVAAMLLVFVALLTMLNYILGKVGQWSHLDGWIASITDGRFHTLSLQLILGYAMAPVIWLLGVAKHDIVLVGQLLGEKIILTELIGYKSLNELKAAGAFFEQKSIIVATYVLCGFANFASIGIQIGGLGTLAPNQKGVVSKYGVLAMIGGTIAALLSGGIISTLLCFK